MSITEYLTAFIIGYLIGLFILGPLLIKMLFNKFWR